MIYNMQREAPRTLLSLSAGYQGMDPGQYEVIVVENGSDKPLSIETVKGFGSHFRYFYLENASPSPAAAVNFGVRQAQGEMVGLMVDGARILSPGIVRHALRALKAYTVPLVSTLAWHLGPDVQARSIPEGYNADVEDRLLAQANWAGDGYRLFTIAALADSSKQGWFMPINESNCLFLLRKTFDQLSGFDERFDEPGGGFVNLDFYWRACELPETELIILLGEGSFHQVHGGIATNAPGELHREKHQRWSAQYEQIRGYPYRSPQKEPDYWGHVPSEALSIMQFSINHAVERKT